MDLDMYKHPYYIASFKALQVLEIILLESTGELASGLSGERKNGRTKIYRIFWK
jgi:hypothetical protein